MTTPAQASTDKKKPKAHKEFGGPFGTFLMIFFLPATVYYINMACSKVCI